MRFGDDLTYILLLRFILCFFFILFLRYFLPFSLSFFFSFLRPTYFTFLFPVRFEELSIAIIADISLS